MNASDKAFVDTNVSSCSVLACAGEAWALFEMFNDGYVAVIVAVWSKTVQVQAAIFGQGWETIFLKFISEVYRQGPLARHHVLSWILA